MSGGQSGVRYPAQLSLLVESGLRGPGLRCSAGVCVTHIALPPTHDRGLRKCTWIYSLHRDLEKAVYVLFFEQGSLRQMWYIYAGSTGSMQCTPLILLSVT